MATFCNIAGLMLALTLTVGVSNNVLAGDESANKYLSNGMRYYGEGDYRSAIIEFKNALKIAPENVEARRKLGYSYLMALDYEGAAKEFKVALNLGAERQLTVSELANALIGSGAFDQLLEIIVPDDSDSPELLTDIYRSRGIAEMALGITATARKSLEMAIALAPTDVRVLLALAAISIAEEQFGEAQQWMERALDTDPANPLVQQANGRFQLHSGNFAAAKAAFVRVLTLNPYHGVTLLGLAETEIHLGDLEAADKALQLAEKASAPAMELQYLKALAALRRGRLATAQTLLREFDLQDNRHPQALLLLATVSWRKGELEQAYDQVKRFLQLAPRSEYAIRLKADIEQKLRMPDQVIETLGNAARNEQSSGLLRALAALTALKRGKAELADDLLSSVEDLTAEEKALLGRVRNQTQAGELDDAIDQLGRYIAKKDIERDADFFAARKLLQTREYDRAITIAGRMSAARPQDPTVWHLKGVAEGLAGYLNDAKESLRKCLSLAPDYAAARNDLARVLLASGDHKKARSEYSQVLLSSPANITALLGMARLEQSSGSLSNALKWVERAEQSEPNTLAPILRKANLLLNSGQLEDAQKALKRAESLDPNHVAYLEISGRLLGLQGKPEAAAKHFIEATKLNPNSSRLYALSGRAMLDSGELSLAAQALRTALELEPAYREAGMLLLHVEIQRGNLDQASDLLGKLRLRWPDDATLLAVQGDLQANQGQRDDAAMSYQLSLGRAAENDELARRVVKALVQLDSADRAIAPLRRRLVFRSQDTATRLLYADTLRIAGNLNDSEMVYRELIAEQPDNVVAINNLSAVLLNRQDVSEAIELAQAAYQLAPKNPAVADSLGWALASANRAKEGLPYLRQAAKYLPEEAEVQLHLATALVQLGEEVEARKTLAKVTERNDTIGISAREILARLDTDKP